MSVEGNKRVKEEYVKTYGITSYDVLGVNLSYAELKELGFYVKDEDEDSVRSFIDEKDGIKTCRIEFACKGIKTGALRRFSFFLRDENRRNNEETADRPLWQYINEQGKVAWSLKPKPYTPLKQENSHYFTGEEGELNPRPAKVGEEGFMEFMRNCMAIDWKSGGTISYDTKKFFSGNFRELKEDLETDFVQPILVATTIQIKDTDEGIKEIESFYNRAFAPGSYNKTILNMGAYTEEDVELLHLKKRDKDNKVGDKKIYINPLEQIILSITGYVKDPSKDGFPCKDIYHLGTPIEYKSDNHVEASTEAIVQEDEDDEPKSTARY